MNKIEKPDTTISNAERALIGMPLLCRVTICCGPAMDTNSCANLKDHIGEYLGVDDRIKNPLENKYIVRTQGLISQSEFRVYRIEILP